MLHSLSSVIEKGPARAVLNSFNPARRTIYSSLLGLVLAPAAMAASSLSGHVTDANGVEPIRDALVSVEWRLVPAGKASGRLVPTCLAVWQTRTDRDGGFRIAAPAEPLVLPSGTALARGGPKLRVLALGRETIQPLQLNLVYSVSNDQRINIVSWPEPNRIIRMQRIDDATMTRQIDDWYAEVQRAVDYDIWPNGTKQARVSYQPFLELISDACIALEFRLNFKPSSCARARAEFDLPTRTPEWVELRPTIEEQPAVEPTIPKVVPGTPDIPGAISGRKQEPPKQ